MDDYLSQPVIPLASAQRVGRRPGGFGNFVSDEKLDPTVLPLRHLIKHLAVDYSRFEKVVTFTGGRVKGELDPSVPQELVEELRRKHEEAQQATDLEEKLRAYKEFHNIGHNMYDDDYREGIAEEFTKTGDFRRWIPGWRLFVEFEYSAPAPQEGRGELIITPSYFCL